MYINKITSYKPGLNAGGQLSGSLYPEFEFKFDGYLSVANLLASLSGFQRNHLEKIIDFLHDDNQKNYDLDSDSALEKVTGMSNVVDNQLVVIFIGLDGGDEEFVAGQLINRKELLQILGDWKQILDNVAKP